MSVVLIASAAGRYCKGQPALAPAYAFAWSPEPGTLAALRAILVGPEQRRLRELAEEHGLGELSIGTSQDYKVAVQEGATLVRVGSILYGE